MNYSNQSNESCDCCRTISISKLSYIFPSKQVTKIGRSSNNYNNKAFKTWLSYIALEKHVNHNPFEAYTNSTLTLKDSWQFFWLW